MNFYGFNSAALNAGVSGIVAGAALVTVVGALAGDGARWVLPTSSPASISAATSNGTRIAPGGGGFIVNSAGSAFPALLQLQSADITTVSTLAATYTDAWSLAAGSITGSGFITRPGAGTSSGVSLVTADGLVTLGFASTINIASVTTADASVKLNGQTQWQRDGYAQAGISGAVGVNALKTALGYAQAVTTSSSTTDSTKTHGGAARFDSTWAVSAIASTDSAKSTWLSLGTASGALTAFSDIGINILSVLTVKPTVTQFGDAISLTQSAAQGTGLLALLSGAAIDTTSSGIADGRPNTFGLADINTLGVLSSDPRLALQGVAAIDCYASLVGEGAIYRMGEASVVALSSASATGGLMFYANAVIASISTMTGDAFTNAEAPDPFERTMRRPFVDRAMTRPFIDRNMKRPA